MNDAPYNESPRAPHAATGDAPGVRDDPHNIAPPIRTSRADFRRHAQPACMDERIRLMHRIAWLDAAFSAAGTLSPTRRRVALSACADILDAADHDDRQFIDQAILCLMRKHGLEPDPSGANGIPKL